MCLQSIAGKAGFPLMADEALSLQGRQQAAQAMRRRLAITQQQAVDQLQVVQDQLAAQKAETKKLSEQMAAMTEKLDALQRSVADIPAPAAAEPVSPPKLPHQ
jgi:uncharacterized coiled-coil protein SlyX